MVEQSPLKRTVAGPIPAGRTRMRKPHLHGVFSYVCGPELCFASRQNQRGLGRRNFVSDDERNIQDTKILQNKRNSAIYQPSLFFSQNTVECTYWASGVIGKRASLRNWWSNPWRFKSSLAHNKSA